MSENLSGMDKIVSIQTRGNEILAKKTFDDERRIIDIIDELAGRYNGVSDYYGIGGIAEAAAFKVEKKGIILHEFFNV